MDCSFPFDEDLDELNLTVSLSGSSLDALHALNPPSPILTPSQVAFSWSSGDIPVLLYDDGYMDLDAGVDAEFSDELSRGVDGAFKKRRDSAQSQATLRLSGGVTAKRASIVDPAAYTQRRISSNGRKAANGTNSTSEGMPSHESSNTVCSAGTFGPRRRTVVLEQDSNSRYSRNSESIILSNDTMAFSATRDTATGGQEMRSTMQPDDLVLPLKRMSAEPIVDVFSDASILPGSNRDSRLADKHNLRHPIGLPGLNGPGDSSRVQNEADFVEDRSITPKKINISTTVSLHSSHDFGYSQYKDYIALEEPSPLSLLESSPESYSKSIQHHQTTPHRRVLAHTDDNVQKEETLRPLHTYHDPRECQKEDSNAHRATKSRSHSPHYLSPQPIRNEMDENDWLRDITIQFLVDQEGFRSAEPSFRFTGIARVRAAQSSKNTEAMVMAQFRPVTRQAFHFHHAPFETPPILRRVTTNGDETHDYVAKQALLTLKHNGVYVLHGQEILAQPNHHLHDPEMAKLYWRFEYLVDDRLTDANSRIMEGEKILTPLTFSCSPTLLLPKQGKKNTLMHVLKKGVATKLVAEKLQPPGAISSRAAPKSNAAASNLPSSQTEAHISHFFASKAHAWSLHRRGQSHGVRHADIHKTVIQRASPLHDGAPQHPPQGPVADARELEAQPTVRRRRNSSAGERVESMANARFSTMVASKHRRDASAHAIPVFATPSRHIVPPAQLTKLLDSAEKENRNTARTSVTRNSNGFVPLAPRPRH